MNSNGTSLMAGRNNGNNGNSQVSQFDLVGAWDDFWSAITTGSGIAGLLNLLAVVGVAVVVMALVAWAWQRRRGGGGGFGQQSSAIWGALLVGCLLSAPQVLIPILLTVLDLVANAAINVWNTTT